MPIDRNSVSLINISSVQASNHPHVQRVHEKIKQFEAEGKEVFIKDSSTRYTRMMTSKFATFENDGYVMSLRTKNCNIHYMAQWLRPVNVGFGFQKNSTYREIFSEVEVFN